MNQSMGTSAAFLKAQAAVFPADRELWRFVVSTALYDIWVDHLRRMEYVSLSQEVHTASSKTIFRLSNRRLRGSTYQFYMGEDSQMIAQVRSDLANILLC